MSFIKFSLLIFLVVAASIDSSNADVCYGDLGCFTDKAPFGGTSVRIVGYLPDSPEKVATNFALFTRQVNNEKINASDLTTTSFNPKVPTKFIVHGFIQHGQKKWMMDMKDAFLRGEDLNVICVDWNKGAVFPYAQASSNTQIAGAEIAKLIRSLVETRGANIADFHIIGHSLGAHVAGYAGERLPNLARITGLDPAGPLFEFTDVRVRLDPSDAKFVDVIHTDGASILQIGLGVFEPAGHVDFYPNGGIDQPNCQKTSSKLFSAIFHFATSNIDALEEESGCSHVAAYKFFTDSIENKTCQYYAYPCGSKKDFDNGKCISCSAKGCNRMGYWATPTKDVGNLYLNTQDASGYPFCKHNFQVTLYSNKVDNLKQALGQIKISFGNNNTVSDEQVIDDSSFIFKPNSVSTHLASLNEQFNDIEKIYLKYVKTTNIFNSWLYDLQWSFNQIKIFDGEQQISKTFCPVKNIIKSGESVEFQLC